MIVAVQMATHIDAMTGDDERTADEVRAAILNQYAECYNALMLVHSEEAKPRRVISANVDLYGSRYKEPS